MGFRTELELKAEYDYLFGSRTVTSENANGLVITSSSTGNLQEAKVGINYRFNWPTLPAAFH
jgi:hypothetical protein